MNSKSSRWKRRSFLRNFLALFYVIVVLISIDSFFNRGQDINRDELTLMRPFFIKQDEMDKRSRLGYKYSLMLYKEVNSSKDKENKVSQF